MPKSKSKDELVDSHVSERQCKLAIEALRNHVLEKKRERDDEELLPTKVQHVWLIVSVKKMYPQHKIKPFKMYVVSHLLEIYL
jgi:ribosome biogenesis protein UTP30